MKKSRACFILTTFMTVLLAASADAMADVVAIVNNANTSADKATVGKLYTLEAKTWPDGSPAKLYDLSGNSERETFYLVYTGKTAGNVKALRAKEVFTRRAVPIKMLNSETEMVNEIAKDKNAVGYVNESSANGSVRIVH
jgi:hypothetical protein